MKNKTVLKCLILIVSLFAFSKISFAVELLNEEQALKEMFPDAEKIVTDKKELSSAEIEKVKSRLGGSLIHRNEGSKSKKGGEKIAYNFYFGIKKGGEKLGVAVIEEQPGKWGPIEFIVAMDIATAKVKNLAVMSYSEKRGRPIARRNFLEQFVNKGSDSSLILGKEIRAISGATISSEVTCFTVKKAIVLYDELYLKNNGKHAVSDNK